MAVLHSFKEEIVLWNEETGETTRLTDFPEDYACLEGSAYLDMFEKNGKLYIFPFFANMILRVDVEKMEISQAFPEIYYDADYDENSENFSSEMYLSAVRDHDCVYAYAVYEKCLDVFDLEAETIQIRTAFKINNPEYKRQLECILDNNVYEESFCDGEKHMICTLENYIINLHQHDISSARRNTDENTIGMNIYNALINE